MWDSVGFGSCHGHTNKCDCWPDHNHMADTHVQVIQTIKTSPYASLYNPENIFTSVGASGGFDGMPTDEGPGTASLGSFPPPPTLSLCVGETLTAQTVAALATIGRMGLHRFVGRGIQSSDDGWRTSTGLVLRL